MNDEIKIPTEIIKLPSKGALYSKDSLLSKGEIEMRYMSAKDEDILTNTSYLREGTTIDKLLQSLIVTPINYDDLLLGDKNAILIAARILGYGKDYEFTYTDPKTRESIKANVDLTTIKDKELDETLIKNGNNFEYKFSKTGNTITFKLLSHGDEKKIEAEVKGLQKITPKGSFESTTRLKYMITSINGKSDSASIREYVDKVMLAPEARELRNYYNTIQPDVILKYYPEDIEEGVNIEIGLNFFWPDFGV